MLGPAGHPVPSVDSARQRTRRGQRWLGRPAYWSFLELSVDPCPRGELSELDPIENSQTFLNQIDITWFYVRLCVLLVALNFPV